MKITLQTFARSLCINTNEALYSKNFACSIHINTRRNTYKSYVDKFRLKFISKRAFFAMNATQTICAIALFLQKYIVINRLRD